eukprot:gene9103-10076_t
MSAYKGGSLERRNLTEGQSCKRKEQANRKIVSPNDSVGVASAMFNEEGSFDHHHHHQQRISSSPQKSSKFSLSKIGKSNSFTIRKKSKETDGKEKKISSYSPQPNPRHQHQQRSQYYAHGVEASYYEDVSKVNAQSRALKSDRSMSAGGRKKGQYRNDDKSIRHRRVKKELPFHMLNPPRIKIEDYSSDYDDDVSFENEYFELVEWAFHILKLNCCFQVQPIFKDVDNVSYDKSEDDDKNRMKVITNETARVGSTLDYILHPISTGAANVLQTGAKLADLTTRIWRDIHFETFVPRRDHKTTNDKP